MDLSALDKVLSAEPAYRRRQAGEAVYKELLADWQKATNLPLNLRDKLSAGCPLKIEAKILETKAEDALKAVIELNDRLKIETVLMKHGGKRRTVCVSSQVGCPLGCLICATGQQGFKRNLTGLEIVEQVIFWARFLKEKKERVTNVVFMGMGEPFLNYDAVLSAVRTLNDPAGLNIGARHISISTIGLPGGIKRLAQEKIQINLAISLHAPGDELRSRLVPANKKYPLETVLRAARDYFNVTGRKIMFEYTLLKGVNDSQGQAAELAALLKSAGIGSYVVNLIAFNYFAPSPYRPSDRKKADDFKKKLAAEGVEATERYRFGREIKAACGQLSADEKI